MRLKKFFYNFYIVFKIRMLRGKRALCGKDWVGGGGDESGRKKFSHNAE